jgi:hypothetical protein
MIQNHTTKRAFTRLQDALEKMENAHRYLSDDIQNGFDGQIVMDRIEVTMTDLTDIMEHIEEKKEEDAA